MPEKVKALKCTLTKLGLLGDLAIQIASTHFKVFV